jgi:phage terminase large subunit-like protein
MRRRPSTNVIDAYARDVVDGRVPAGKYHRAACARHLRDREREGTPEFPYRFDLERAERFFRFAEKLKHYKGEWAGQLIRLQPHQKFRKGCKYGWVHVETGLRRFRNSYEEIPRKNGKSLELATETLYLTFFDGEGGAEGYTAATKREQALIIFNDCKKLVQSSGLKDRLKVQVSNIHDPKTNSKLEPLSADYNSMDGLNVHVVSIDELHAHKTRGVIDVLETATGARRQPFVNKITTAGDDPVSPCGDEHDYACKVLDGILEDETYFAFIAHADEGDDWTLPETAAKANPNYGVSVNPEDLASKVAKAKNLPAAAAAYKQKHLNLWVNTTAPCLSVDGWRKGQSSWTPEDMAHEPCYAGIDLASKIDLCVLSLCFPPTAGRRQWRVIQRIWTPADTLADRAHRDKAPYQVWVDQGWLIATPGTRIDHSLVKVALLEARELYDLELIGFDPWHADKLVEELIAEGFTEEQVLAVPQTYLGMSSACLSMQADILSGDVDARGCPVTAWSVSNTVGQRDGKDNLMFTKGKSRGRIDPVIAPTIARSLWLKQPTPAESVYLTRGVRSLADYL